MAEHRGVTRPPMSAKASPWAPSRSREHHEPAQTSSVFGPMVSHDQTNPRHNLLISVSQSVISRSRPAQPPLHTGSQSSPDMSVVRLDVRLSFFHTSRDCTPVPPKPEMACVSAAARNILGCGCNIHKGTSRPPAPTSHNSHPRVP